MAFLKEALLEDALLEEVCTVTVRVQFSTVHIQHIQLTTAAWESGLMMLEWWRPLCHDPFVICGSMAHDLHFHFTTTTWVTETRTSVMEGVLCRFWYESLLLKYTVTVSYLAAISLWLVWVLVGVVKANKSFILQTVRPLIQTLHQWLRTDSPYKSHIILLYKLQEEGWHFTNGNDQHLCTSHMMCCCASFKKRTDRFRPSLKTWLGLTPGGMPRFRMSSLSHSHLKAFSRLLRSSVNSSRLLNAPAAWSAITCKLMFLQNKRWDWQSWNASLFEPPLQNSSCNFVLHA